MNKSNTSQIKIRRKPSFRPIMITSKSMKPVERSHQDKFKQEDRNSMGSHPLSSIKRRLSQNCALYSTEINKADIIKKMANEYREELISNLTRNTTSHKKNRCLPKPMTPSVIQVEFDNDFISNKSRYDRMLCGIDANNFSENLNRYLQCPNSKNIDNSIKKTHHTNNFIAFKLFSKKQPRHDQEWVKLMDNHYLNVKKIRPDHSPEPNIPEDKLAEITQKVEEYQNTLLKKMQDRFKAHVASDCEDGQECSSPLEPQESKSKRKLSGDYSKIEQDILAKRQTFKKQHFIFTLSETTKMTVEQINRQKFDNYKDFLWKLNFSNGLYVRIRDEIDTPYKLYVGPGNNAMLIKGIMRRRFWWQTVEKMGEDFNFAWTQIKVNDCFKMQIPSRQRSIQLSNRSNIILNNRKTLSAMEYHSNTQRKEDLEIYYHICKNQENEDTPIQAEPNERIFNRKDFSLWTNHLQSYRKQEEKLETAYPKRLKTMLRKKPIKYIEDSKKLRIHNHFECNFYLGNKKALFYSLRKYYTHLEKDPFVFIPLTFHISKGFDDQQYHYFLQKYEQFQEKKKKKEIQNIWIVKPGELTNRGRGITVCSTLDQIKIRIRSKEKAKNGQLHTYIVQKYIEKPLLYYKRKFDIRHYMLMSCINGKLKGYWYEEGYLRTTSSEYNIKNCKDLYTHLTNDAIQKNSSDYGKFEKGNKVSYADFQKYLNSQFRRDTKEKQKKYDFFGTVLPKMKQLATDAMKATYMMLTPKHYEHNFQLFGLDFMLDEDMNVYLIEVNTNPCLETSSPLLARLIPSVIENVLKICVDPLFPPPFEWLSMKKMQMGENALEENRFSLIFDEEEEGEDLRKLYDNWKEENMGEIDEEDQVYEDQGKQWVEEN